MIERFFDALIARDWHTLRDVLGPEVARVGPFGDRITGREAYFAFLAASVPTDYRNDLHLVTYVADGAPPSPGVTEHFGYPNETLHFEEAYVFELDGTGAVTRIELPWQAPERPGGSC